MRLASQEVNGMNTARVPQPGLLARIYIWACERLYDEFAGQYDLVSHVVSFGQWRRWQMGVWRGVQGQAILEIGSGTGVMVEEGLRRGFRIVGIERSPQMLAVAQQRLRNQHASLVEGDGRALPVEAGTIDTVMATFPAGYILHAETLAEMRRILRNHGCVVIVGLWVELRLLGLERMIPFFYGRPRVQVLDKTLAQVSSAGFQAKWLEEQHGLFTVGILVAQRE